MDALETSRLGRRLGGGLRAVRGRRPPAGPGRRRPSRDLDRPRRRGRPAGGVSGAFRYAALAHADFPTVGDWVALGGRRRHRGRAAAPERVQADGRGREPTRDAHRRRADHGLQHRRRPARRRPRQRLQPAPDRALPRGRLVERRSAPVVVLNKADLADDVDGRLVAVDAIAPGVATVAVSARTGDGLDELRAHLRPGTTAAILGSSGVGKSTLVNALLGEDRQATGEVRDADSRGRHTTTHRELFELPGGALLVDTPGHPVARGRSAPTRASTPPSTTSSTRRDVPVQRLPARGRAGLRDPGRARRREPHRGAPREPPQARARARAGRPRGATRGPGPSTAGPGRSSTSPSNEHMKRKYGAER